MTFVSYAQNYEDVILRRALGDVEKGFYIDVGAYHPFVDSVSKAFYDAGWHGINIEPVSEWYKKLQQDRPNDINLQIAVGARKGNLDFFEVVGTGLSTHDKLIAERHVQEHKLPRDGVDDGYDATDSHEMPPCIESKPFIPNHINRCS